MMSWVTDVARAINRRTHRLDWLKDRLGLTRFASTRLVRELTADDVTQIRENLDTTSLLRDVREDAHFIVVLVDKMGDVLACTCVARFLKAKYPHSHVTWFVKSAYRDLLERNPSIDEIVAVTCLSEAMDAAEERIAEDPKAVLVNLHFDGATCHKTGRCFRNLQNPAVNTSTYFALGSLSESFSLAAGLPMVSGGPELFLPSGPDVPLPRRYAVCHTASDDPARNWRADAWNAVAAGLRSRGLSVVEIGGQRVLQHADVDFCGMRKLTDVAQIIRQAACFVGIDSGFAHFANALAVPSVIVIGRFRNFPAYSPYSGAFSESAAFVLRRAPGRRPASEAMPDSVLADIDTVLAGGRSA